MLSKSHYISIQIFYWWYNDSEIIIFNDLFITFKIHLYLNHTMKDAIIFL